MSNFGCYSEIKFVSNDLTNPNANPKQLSRRLHDPIPPSLRLPDPIRLLRCLLDPKQPSRRLPDPIQLSRCLPDPIQPSRCLPDPIQPPRRLRDRKQPSRCFNFPRDITRISSAPEHFLFMGLSRSEE